MAAAKERWECPNCGTPLNIAPLGIYAKVACPACGHVDHVHTVLANFRLEGVLGLGGMSVVLRARDLVLDRPLAIKLLNEFYRDQPERIARFEQECALMAKVRHENVVSVYSAGNEKGQFYIAMELVNGRNLEELVRTEGPMEPARALEVLRQVIHGLDAAHKAGLLHRDMKPGNILMCDDGRAKVLDFGLSLGKRDVDSEEIIWATPYYVPPETLNREPEDARTDIYALGMTLRYLLTGEQEFDSAPESIDEMLECKRQLLSMAEEMPELSEAYCELIDHMTAFNPADRPSSYASLLSEVEDVYAALMEELHGPSIAMRLKRRLPLLAGTLLTLALGGAAALLTARLMTPAAQPLYLTPDTALAWPERDLLADATEQLYNGQLQEAAELMARLADSEGEPTACAWASWHAWALSILLGEEETEVARWRERADYHLARTPASAGQELHGQMASLATPQASPENKFLQAITALSRLSEARTHRHEEEVERQLQALSAALSAAGEAYAPMLELLSLRAYEFAAEVSASPQGSAESVAQEAAAEPGQSAPPAEQAAAQQAYVRSLLRLDASRMEEQFMFLRHFLSDATALNRFVVQSEALTLYAHGVRVLMRYGLVPQEGLPEPVTHDAMKSLFDRLGEPGLGEEMVVLALLAEGRFDAAAAQNPCANAPDSSSPFAVMLRDWFSRVGM